MTAKVLTEKAVSAGIITSAQAEEIARLRMYRNTYAHFQSDSRCREAFFAQMDAAQDDPSVEGIDANMVLRPDAKAAVMLASAYFLQAGRDGFSEPIAE